MRTEAQAMTDCLTRHEQAVCAEIIASQRVNGVYCDGTIVIDGSGHRCVPAELKEQVERVRKASPLPVPVVVVGPASEPGFPWAIAIGAALVVAFLVWRR